MSNPQQPELARSRKTPALDPDASAAVIDGQGIPAADAPGGPIPVDNQPGHHPPVEQDKPPIEKFAAKLGTMEPDERKEVLKDEPPSVVNPAPAPAPAARRAAMAGVAALVAVVLAVVAGRRRRSRR